MTPLPYRHAVTLAAFFLLAAASFVLASGCVINFTVGSPEGTGGSGGVSTPPPDPTSAGQGGTCAAESSGAGNTGAGGSSCVGADGTGQTSTSCDTMEITPSSAGGPAASNCDACGGSGGTYPPLGYSVCLRAFEVFTAGSAEALQACLNRINGAPAYACAIGPVADCMTRMYDDACPSQSASDTCQAIGDTLCVLNEPFDVIACAENLKPFNDGALQRMAGCIAYSSEPDCLIAYTVCFDQVTGY